MDSERMVWKGQRQEKLEQARVLETSIHGLRDSIRTGLNPHAPISEINHDLVSQQAFELADKVIQYKQLSKEITAINNSLGIK